MVVGTAVCCPSRCHRCWGPPMPSPPSLPASICFHPFYLQVVSLLNHLKVRRTLRTSGGVPGSEDVVSHSHGTVTLTRTLRVDTMPLSSSQPTSRSGHCPSNVVTRFPHPRIPDAIGDQARIQLSHCVSPVQSGPVPQPVLTMLGLDSHQTGRSLVFPS